MSSPVIQANYDQLDAIAARFGQRAEAVTTLHGHVLRSYQALEDGGWIGRGFSAFSTEMQGEIFPALERLTHALDEARAVTLQVSAIMREAEEEAASLFQGGPQGDLLGGGGTPNNASVDNGRAGDGGRGMREAGVLSGILVASGFSPGVLGVASTVGGWLKTAQTEFSISAERGKTGAFDPGIEVKFPFFEGSAWSKDFPLVSTSVFGIPTKSTLNTQLIGGEGGLGSEDTSKDGMFVGAYGEVYAAKATNTTVFGTKDLGFTQTYELKVLSAEGFLGYKDGTIGGSVGVNLVSFKSERGFNVAGYNVGVSAEVGIKKEWGFKIGKEGLEVKLPFFSVGISFGGAK